VNPVQGFSQIESNLKKKQGLRAFLLTKGPLLSDRETLIGF
jgi:hypothetical protein